MIQTFPNVRFLLVCFASISVALPVGIISVSKLLLFVCALAVIVCGWMGRGDIAANLPSLASFTILMAMAVVAASALWSTGSTQEILTAVAKHGKLLTIPIFLCLARSRREASIALALFVGGQAFLLGQVVTASHLADIPVSSGTRVKLWRGSLQSITENPLHGTGVGSWSQEFNRQQERHEPTTPVKIAGNPHQEFLLWGVELGISGIALLCLIILSIYRDSRRFDQQTRRALQSVLMAMTVACLFNSILYDAQIGDFFCVALGLLLALGYHAKPAALPFVCAPVRS